MKNFFAELRAKFLCWWHADTCPGHQTFQRLMYQPKLRRWKIKEIGCETCGRNFYLEPPCPELETPGPPILAGPPRKEAPPNP